MDEQELTFEEEAVMALVRQQEALEAIGRMLACLHPTEYSANGVGVLIKEARAQTDLAKSLVIL